MVTPPQGRIFPSENPPTYQNISLLYRQMRLQKPVTGGSVLHTILVDKVERFKRTPVACGLYYGLNFLAALVPMASFFVDDSALERLVQRYVDSKFRLTYNREEDFRNLENALNKRPLEQQLTFFRQVRRYWLSKVQNLSPAETQRFATRVIEQTPVNGIRLPAAERVATQIVRQALKTQVAVAYGKNYNTALVRALRKTPRITTIDLHTYFGKPIRIYGEGASTPLVVPRGLHERLPEGALPTRRPPVTLFTRFRRR